MKPELENFSDEALVLRCRSCSKEEQNIYVSEITRRHYRPLYQYIFRMVNHAQVAEDLLQDAFLNFYKNLHQYKEVAKVSTWLYRIAINLTLNEIRNHKVRSRVKRITWEDESANPLEQFPHGSATPLKVLEKRELEENIQRILSQLPEKHREVLVLCDIQGLDYEEIGELLNLKLGTVKSRISRAREKFAQMLEPYFFKQNREGQDEV